MMCVETDIVPKAEKGGTAYHAAAKSLEVVFM